LERPWRHQCTCRHGLGGDDSLKSWTVGGSQLNGGDGNDTLRAATASDTVTGGEGDDYILLNFLQIGGTGASIDGGSGDDTLDIYFGSTVRRRCPAGWAGTDTLFLDTAGEVATLAMATFSAASSGFELLKISGTTVSGDGNANTLDFSAFDLSGASDALIVNGLDGDDALTSWKIGGSQLNGGDGNDTLDAATASDTVTGGEGDDFIYFNGLGSEAPAAVVDGGNGDDTVDFYYGATVGDGALQGGAGPTRCSSTIRKTMSCWRWRASMRSRPDSNCLNIFGAVIDGDKQRERPGLPGLRLVLRMPGQRARCKGLGRK